MNNSKNNEKLNLEHVFWVGGCPAGGKTTFANYFSERYGFYTYHTDKQAYNIYQKTKSGDYPNFLKMAETDFDRLLFLPDDEWLEISILSMKEIFSMFISDLQKMPRDKYIIAEGAELLPVLLQDNCENDKVVFAIPSYEFFMKNLPEQKWVENIFNHLQGNDYKKQFIENLLHKYNVFREYLFESAEELNLKIVITNDRTSFDENIKILSNHFSLIGRL